MKIVDVGWKLDWSLWPGGKLNLFPPAKRKAKGARKRVKKSKVK